MVRQHVRDGAAAAPRPGVSSRCDSIEPACSGGRPGSSIPQPATVPGVRILISLSGLHRVRRGAEIAFESIASGLADLGHAVTIYGSGPTLEEASYAYRHLPVIRRERFERWPSAPPFRDPTTYESLSFMPGLLKAFRPAAFDATMTCGFPIENIALRRPSLRRQRPPHIFVTQNGDWPAQLRTKESRLFSCDGLVCTNPVYFERNRDRWTSALIPNGVDVSRFSPGPQARQRLGLPLDQPIVLMVSALIASKRIEQAIPCRRRTRRCRAGSRR